MHYRLTRNILMIGSAFWYYIVNCSRAKAIVYSSQCFHILPRMLEEIVSFQIINKVECFIDTPKGAKNNSKYAKWHVTTRHGSWILQVVLEKTEEEKVTISITKRGELKLPVNNANDGDETNTQNKMIKTKLSAYIIRCIPKILIFETLILIKNQ